MTSNEINIAIDNFLDQKITPLKQQHKIAFFVAALLIPCVLFYLMYYSPKTKEIKALANQKIYLIGEIKKVEATVAKLDQHKAEKKATEEKFKEASLLLPGEKEIPSLLTNISSLGTNSGLEVLSFTPGTETPKQFYSEILLRLRVRGPYHNVGIFLDKISKLPRIVSAAEINMGGPKMEEGVMVLNTNISLLTYRFTEKRQ